MNFNSINVAYYIAGFVFVVALACNSQSVVAQTTPLNSEQRAGMALVAAKMEFHRQLRQWIIGHPGDPSARKELLSMAENQYIPDDRGYAVEVIGHLPTDSRSRPKLKEEYYRTFLPVLLKALDDEDYYVRRAAVDACGHFKSYAKEAVAKIAKFLYQADKDISLHAARALAEMGPTAEEAVPALIEALKVGPALPTQGGWLGEEAIKALGAIGPAAKEAIPSLQKATEEQNAQYRALAEEALRKINPS